MNELLTNDEIEEFFHLHWNDSYRKWRPQDFMRIRWSVWGACISPYIVEIGTFVGYTARLMSAAQKHFATNGVVITVDSYRGPLKNMARGVKPELILKNKIMFVGMSSEEFANRTFFSPGFVFIDGCHCKECVITDMRSWMPRIPEEGCVMFHDVRDRRIIRESCLVHYGRRMDVLGAINAMDIEPFELVDSTPNDAVRVYKRKSENK